MSSLRDIKLQMRGDLHLGMSVPALYTPAPDETPLDCTVRIWLKSDLMAAQDGVQGGADLANPEDRIRFSLAEIPVLRRNAVVSVEVGEAYRIDFLYPVDLGYQTARVLRLTAAEAEDLPVPE